MSDDRRRGSRQHHSNTSELPHFLHSDAASHADGMRMLRIQQVMQIVGLKKAYIYQLQKSGLFPRGVKLGVRAVGWIESDVRAWLVERTKTGEAATKAITLSSGGIRDEPRSGAFPVSTRGQLTGYFMQAHEYEELQVLGKNARDYQRVRVLWAELSALLTDSKTE